MKDLVKEIKEKHTINGVLDIDEAMLEFGYECCELQKIECANNVSFIDEMEYIDCNIGYQRVKRIDEDSILYCINVVK